MGVWTVGTAIGLYDVIIQFYPRHFCVCTHCVVIVFPQEVISAIIFIFLVSAVAFRSRAVMVSLSSVFIFLFYSSAISLPYASFILPFVVSVAFGPFDLYAIVS